MNWYCYWYNYFLPRSIWTQWIVYRSSAHIVAHISTRQDLIMWWRWWWCGDRWPIEWQGWWRQLQWIVNWGIGILWWWRRCLIRRRQNCSIASSFCGASTYLYWHYFCGQRVDQPIALVFDTNSMSRQNVSTAGMFDFRLEKKIVYFCWTCHHYDSASFFCDVFNYLKNKIMYIRI